MADKIKVSRNIFIGLGGTGQKAILHIKHKFLSNYNEIPPTIRLLAIDSDNPTEIEDPILGTVGFDGSEFLKIELKNPQKYIEHHEEEVNSWLPSIPIDQLRRLTEGAGQVRAAGRLSLLSSQNPKKIVSTIQRMIADVSHWKTIDSGKYEVVDETPKIVIFTSLAGGTGSGIFLDVASLCREISGEAWKIFGYLLLPGIYRKYEFTYNVDENSYAALKELDYVMGLNPSQPPAGVDISDFEQRADTVNYIVAYPFDAIMLIDYINKENSTYESPDVLAKAIGLGIYLTSGHSVGKKTTSVWVNSLTHFGKQWKTGKKAYYSSFGCSEGVLLSREHAEIRALEYVRKLLEVLLKPEQENITNGEVEEFISVNNLRERGEADEIIDSIYDKTRLPRLNKPRYDKDKLKQLIARLSDHIINAEQEIKNESRINTQALLERTRRSLKDYIENRAQLEGGINFVRKFLPELGGYFKQVKDELNKEIENHERELKIFEQQKIDYESNFERNASKLFGAKDLERELDGLVNTVNKIVLVKAEIIRKQQGVSFCASIMDEIDSYISIFDNYIRIDSELRKGIAERRNKIEQKIATLEAFRKKIDFTNVRQTPSPVMSEFHNWLKSRNVTFLELIKEGKPDKILSELISFTRSQDFYKKTLNMNILDALKELMETNKAQVEDIFNSLRIKSSPLWRLNDGLIESGAHIDTIYIVGIPYEDSYFDEKRIAELLGEAQSSVSIVATGEKGSIYIYQWELCCPAYVVEGIDSLKREYLNHRNLGVPFHIDKRWEKYLADLFPEQDSESVIFWALLASVDERLQRIKKIGTKGYVYMGHNGQVSLGKDRKEALTRFLKNKQLLEEAKEIINKFESEIQDEMVKIAKNQITELEEIIKQYGSDYELCEVLMKEIQALRQYIQTFGI